MLLFLLLLIAPVHADVCYSGSAEECTETLESVVSALEGAVEEDVPLGETWEGMPSGDLSTEDVVDAFEELRENGDGLPDGFAMLADGQERVLPGGVVRDLMQEAGIDLGILPLDDLVEVRTDGESMEFIFDFDRAESIDLRTPKTEIVVLKNGRAKTRKSGGDRITVRDRVKFDISPEGITGVREGDLVGHLFFFSATLDFQTVREPGRVATDGGDPILVTDADGEPVVGEDGNWEFRTYDDWLVVHAGPGDPSYVGIPAF